MKRPWTGVLRILLFVEAHPTLFAIQHRPAKKREGETSLPAIDLDTLEVRQLSRLPPSARGLLTEPPFHLLDVSDGPATVTAHFNVVRTR